MEDAELKHTEALTEYVKVKTRIASVFARVLDAAEARLVAEVSDAATAFIKGATSRLQ